MFVRHLDLTEIRVHLGCESDI